MAEQITLKFREINKNIFNAIKKGKKKIETRAATVKYCKIGAGDTIKFLCDGDSFKKKARSTQIFKTIDALLAKYKVRDINPYLSSRKELEEMYHSFPDYKENIKKFGIIVIEVE